VALNTSMMVYHAMKHTSMPINVVILFSRELW
jgi:hypothetical protein